MITNFKIFEANKSKPKTGDYVFIQNISFEDKRIQNYCNTHIGKILAIRNRDGKGMLPRQYTIEYDLPEELGIKAYYYIYNDFDIIYWSKNIKEVELLMKTTKYNI